jgi:hypothetical protein
VWYRMPWRNSSELELILIAMILLQFARYVGVSVQVVLVVITLGMTVQMNDWVRSWGSISH